MEFRILGPLEVVGPDGPIPLGGPLQRAVLALLLTRANEVVSTDRLVDELWSGEPPRTAANTIQYYVSQLRKLLGSDRILTRPPGYAIRIDEGELDLDRFERLVASGDADGLREALDLWRGPPLADFAYASFAGSEIGRLEELRLAALEERIEADLAFGRHAQLVGELEALVRDHPLRERLRAQLMLALYRSGRQAEALEAYQDARRTLVEELGIEPGAPLQRLEKAILVHDPELDLQRPAPQASPTTEETRAILVAPQAGEALDDLLALAEPLAGGGRPREIVVACLTSAEELTAATALANDRRAALAGRGVAARAAAFTSDRRGDDLVRLATELDADLVLLDCPPAEGALSGNVGVLLADAPCDVALLCGGRERPDPGPGRPLLVPFGGAEHDWSAVELAAWIAASTDAPLRLAGTEAGGRKRARDASRLLASASLLVQRAVGVATEPLLVPPGAGGIIEAAAGAGLVVAGLSERWRHEGLGEARAEIARRAHVPLLLVRRGLRPGGIAPQENLTRFTWSLRLGR
jgi:DNA-binding SARP family transcriptional activator